MASVNKVIIIGNLGRDPEIRYMPSGDAIATLAVATTDTWKDKTTGEKKEQTEWHRINFFGRTAEVCGQYLKKGSSVYVEGSLRTRKYVDKDGVEKYATDIKGDVMQMLGGRPGGGGGGDVPMDDGYGSTSAPPPQRQNQYQNQNAGNGGGANSGNSGNSTPAPRPAQKPAPNFSDMDDDIPF